MQHRGETPPRPREDAEARLSAYFADYAAQTEHGSLAYLLRHPVAGARAFQDLAGVPVLRVEPSGGLEGRLVREALPSTTRGPRSLAAALALPSTPEAYSQGASKQTLRRKIRAAERAGVTWTRVTDPDEKRLLLERSNEYERTHPLQQYRKAPPDNAVLRQVDLWLVARAADGRPLVLSVTPISGTWALLGLFRVFEGTDEASAARYLLTKVLAEHLIERGVTHLFDGVHPANLSNGLRHFQRMMGFRLVRIAQQQHVAELARGSLSPQR